MTPGGFPQEILKIKCHENVSRVVIVIFKNILFLQKFAILTMTRKFSTSFRKFEVKKLYFGDVNSLIEIELLLEK